MAPYLLAHAGEMDMVPSKFIVDLRFVGKGFRNSGQLVVQIRKTLREVHW